MIINCNNLKRTFNTKIGERTVLNNITFSVNNGDIYGIIGPNGAGKTTLINIISTMLTPTSYDKLEINGYDIISNYKRIKNTIGVVPANSNSLYMKLTAKENLEFFSALYRITGNRCKQKIEEVLSLVELEKYKNEYVENFSTGMKQRLMIARALIHEPKLLILDEPTSGLDPRTANNIRNLLLKANSTGISIIIATHNMDEAESICSILSVFNNGSIVISGRPKNIIKEFGNNVVVATVRESVYDVETFLKEKGIKDVRLINSDSGTSKIRFVENTSNNIILKLIIDHGLVIDNYQRHETTLEDVFFESLKRGRV